MPLSKVPILTIYELAVKKTKKKKTKEPNQVKSKLPSFDDLICRMKAARLPPDDQMCWAFRNWNAIVLGLVLEGSYHPHHFQSVQTANENGNYRIVRLHAIGAENRRKDRRKSISCPRRRWVDSSLLKTPLNTFQLGFLFVFHRMKEKWKLKRTTLPHRNHWNLIGFVGKRHH